MIESPLVSIIVPNYNYARFLDLRMNSILAQTYNNYEIIILDDCSCDNSREIIEKYRRNSKVSDIILNDKNSGSPFIQWQKGINLAKGDIIWIAESDDTCSSLFLEKLVRKYVESNAVLTFCRSTLVDVDGLKMRDNRQMNSVCVDVVMEGKAFISRFLGFSNEVQNASCAIFSRRMAQDIDHDFMSYKGAGDWLFWIKMAERGVVCFVNEELNNYRLHNNTTSSVVKNGVEFHEMKSIYEWLLMKRYLTPKQYSTCRKNNILLINSLKEIPYNVKHELYNMWGMTCFEIFCVRLRTKLGSIKRKCIG